jgi:hypothetical protein
MTMVISGSDGVTFPDSTNQFSGGAFSFKNRILNGDMRIDQRNAGAAVTVNASGTFFPVDRFFGTGQATDGVFTLDQNTTAPAGFVNSVVATVTTVDASIGATQFYIFNQYIEGTNVSDLAWGTASAKTVTLSFWTRSSLTGTFGGVISNSAQNRSYPFTYSISVADTWEYKTITIAGDTSGTWLTDTGIGIRLHFDLGVGSTYRGTAGSWAGATYLGATGATDVISTLNATWYITGVQLEVGSVATPFERRPYGTELSLCQRYYQLIACNGRARSGGVNHEYEWPINFYNEMRATPTSAIFTTGINTNLAGGTPSLIRLNSKGASLYLVAAASGDFYGLDYVASFSAEL